MSTVDEFLAEMDMLALADAVGVLGGPREPSGEVLTRGRAVREASVRRVGMDRRRAYARAFEAIACDAPADTERVERERREFANMLAASGFDLDYITRRVGVEPRRGDQS